MTWYFGNSGKTTHPVKRKKPNGLGLYDMSGNVWEWCWDWYSDKAKPPCGPASGSCRVIRGGNWSGGVDHVMPSIEAKSVRLNVYAEDSDGRQYDIKIQNATETAMKEGRREGKRIVQAESVGRMLRAGLPIEDIAKYLGMTVEEVEKVSASA